MHELSIAMSIVEVAAAEAERHGAVQVTAVHLRWGPLSGVVKEALLSAFELAREGSPLERSGLVIEDVPILAYCPQCRSDCSVESIQQLCCRTCGTPTPHVVSGRELEITALEIADDEPDTIGSGPNPSAQAQ